MTNTNAPQEALDIGTIGQLIDAIAELPRHTRIRSYTLEDQLRHPALGMVVTAPNDAPEPYILIFGNPEPF